MLNTLSNMPETSRLWVYQSSRNFSPSELRELPSMISSFIVSWTAHGAELQAAFEIKYNRFIVIAVDEEVTNASGCSIDKLVRFMKELGQMLQVDFFDRMHVAYRDGKQEIQSCSYSDFEKRIIQKVINESTPVFNNMVISKKEFDVNWEVPLIQSWHQRALV